MKSECDTLSDGEVFHILQYREVILAFTWFCLNFV